MFLPKGWELVVILLVVLVIFGPKNLPKLGKSVGGFLHNVRSGMEVKKKPEDDYVEYSEEEGDSQEDDGEQVGTALLVAGDEAASADVAEAVEAEADVVEVADEKTVEKKRVRKAVRRANALG